MHQTSLDNMRLCYERYVRGTALERQARVHVLDIGAADINGSYRGIFAGPQFEYIGADLGPGSGVSVVLEDPYTLPFADGSIDIVVCGQMLEHSEFFWVAFAEMIRVLKRAGYLFLIAPSAGSLHRHPVDTYRFMPDSYRALAKYAGCELIDLWWDARSSWHDLVGVFQRLQSSIPAHPADPPTPGAFLATGSAWQPAYVHVGVHKTGSTAFQSYVSEWRTELLLDHGVLVHRGCFGGSHFELSALTIRNSLDIPGRWLIARDPHAPSVAEMTAAVRRTVESDAPAVLFSTEELAFIRMDDEVEALTRLLSPRRIVPIVVLRDPDEYLSSYRRTLERMGFPHTSDDPTSASYVERDSWLVDHDSLLRALRQLAGSGQVTQVDYESEMAREGSVVPALAEAIGLERRNLYPGWDRLVDVTEQHA